MKTYLLVKDIRNDRVWYGLTENNTWYWTGWQDISDLSDHIEELFKEEECCSLEEFQKELNSSCVAYVGTEKEIKTQFPEYFI